MSDNLLTEDEGYIQSPTDDIESFFWTFFWAILQNHTASYSDRERGYADKFRNGLRDRAFRLYVHAGDSAIQDIVSKWEKIVGDLSNSYVRLSESLAAISKAKLFKDVEEEARYWKAAWHGLALEGVYMSLKVLLECA